MNKLILMILILVLILVSGCTQQMENSNESNTSFTLVCNPGSYRCDENYRDACSPDGTSWQHVEVCSSDEICTLDSCIPNPSAQNCSDGTRYGQCSSNKPEYCIDGVFVNSCNMCGCLPEQICSEKTGNCYSNSSALAVLPLTANIDSYPSSRYFVNPYLFNFSVANFGSQNTTVFFAIDHDKNGNNDIYPYVTLSKANATMSPVGNTSELNDSELATAVLTKGVNVTASIIIPENALRMKYYDGYINVKNSDTAISIPIFLTIHPPVEYVNLMIDTSSSDRTIYCNSIYIITYVINSGTVSSGQVTVNATGPSGVFQGSCIISNIDSNSTGMCSIAKSSGAGSYILYASNGNVGNSAQVFCTS